MILNNKKNNIYRFWLSQARRCETRRSLFDVCISLKSMCYIIKMFIDLQLWEVSFQHCKFGKWKTLSTFMVSIPKQYKPKLNHLTSFYLAGVEKQLFLVERICNLNEEFTFFIATVNHFSAMGRHFIPVPKVKSNLRVLPNILELTC